MDIRNYVAYLNAVHFELLRGRSIQTTLLGFSQGAATAMRWAMNDAVSFDRLVLWAGLFPADIDFAKGAELLRGKKVIEVLGRRDEYINEERVAEMHRLNAQLNISPSIIEFDGKHEIDTITLMEIARG
jgi:predicted esterase